MPSQSTTALAQSSSVKRRVQVEDFRTRELAQLAWGMYTVQIYNNALLRAIVERVKAEAVLFESGELVSLLYTFTRFKYLPAKKSGMYQAALAVLLKPQRADELTPQDVANVLWALARAEIRVDAAALDDLAARALERVPVFTPQELANTAYAFGKLQHSHPALMQVRARLLFVLCFACARLASRSTCTRLMQVRLFVCLFIFWPLDLSACISRAAPGCIAALAHGHVVSTNATTLLALLVPRSRRFAPRPHRSLCSRGASAPTQVCACRRSRCRRCGGGTS